MATPKEVAPGLKPKPKVEKPPKSPKPNRLPREGRKLSRHLKRLSSKMNQVKNWLVREIELTKKSSERGKLEWEKMCGAIKLEEFQKEIELWAEQIDILIKRKDDKIDFLMDTLDQSHEKYDRSFSRHLDQLDYLNGCFEALRQSATAIYETQAREMVHEFLCELSYVQDNNLHFCGNMENIAYTTNVVTKQHLRRNYELYMERKFGKATTEVQKRNILRDDTASKMKDLHDQLLQFIKVLKGDMVDVHKTEKFLHFMERQRNYVVESHKLNKVEQNCLRTIEELRHDLMNIEAEANKKIYGFKLELSYLLEVKSILANAIKRNKEATYKKVLDVSSESYEVLKKLKEIVKYGELMIDLAKCCRKLQTEKEKVLPINPEADETESRLSFEMAFDIVKHLDMSEDDIAGQVDLLKNFWRRCSDIKIHNLMLTEEKRKLSEENEQYRGAIRSMKKSDSVKQILQSLEIKALLTSETSLE